MLEQTIENSRQAVAEVARAALARSLAGGAAEVPPLLVQAVASGTGDREAVHAATRQAFGTEKPLELVLFDTDRIGSYVFESSRPPVITGASTLLRYLNDCIARERYRQWVVFSGGGEGILLVPAGQGKDICRAIEALYATETERALDVTTGHLAVGPHDFIGTGGEASAAGGARLVSGTPALLSQLRDQVRRKKDERGPGSAAVAGGQERCVSCRDRAAGSRTLRSFRPDAPIDGGLCDPCARRWDVGRKRIGGLSFEELIGAAAGPERGKSSYIGFLYVDGNSMGALFGGLTSLAEIRFLSQAVGEVFERLHARARKLAQAFPRSSAADEPMVSFLGGGDEVIWILPARLAVQVAAELQSWVEAESKAITDLPKLLSERTGRPSLTFGAGLVLCGYSYPVRYQYSLAKELQKNAKSLFYGAPAAQSRSSIDFEVLTDASPLSEDLETMRAITDRTHDPDFRRSCRPYTAEAFTELVDRMRRLRADDVRLATSQLYTLQDGLREGRRIFLNLLRYQIARKPAGLRYQRWLQALSIDPAQQAQIEDFFVLPCAGGTGTWIADGLQLAPFLVRQGS